MTSPNPDEGCKLYIKCITVGNEKKLRSPGMVKQYLEQATKRCGMTDLGQLIVNVKDETSPEKAGVTGVKVWGESHLNVHTWSAEGRVEVEMQACGERGEAVDKERFVMFTEVFWDAVEKADWHDNSDQLVYRGGER